MNIEMQNTTLSQRRMPDDIARKMHIQQFWSPNFERDPHGIDYTIKRLSKSLGLPESDLEQQTWEEHTLIAQLLHLGNKEAAKKIGHDPSLIRDQQQELLVDIAAWQIVLREKNGEQMENNWISVEKTELENKIREIKPIWREWIEQLDQRLKDLVL